MGMRNIGEGILTLVYKCGVGILCAWNFIINSVINYGPSIQHKTKQIGIIFKWVIVQILWRKTRKNIVICKSLEKKIVETVKRKLHLRKDIGPKIGYLLNFIQI